MGRVLAIAGVGAGMAVASAAIALSAAAGAGADPASSLNCAYGAGAMYYCDSDVAADGSWSRCSRQDAGSVSVLGAGAYAPAGSQSCERVTPESVPVGSPPHHIGYGGEAAGRV